MANVAELISEALELGAVGVDRKIALLYRAKFCLEKNSTLKLIVTEVSFDIRPEGEGSDVWFMDEVEDISGDSGVDPVYQTTVDLTPLAVALGSRRRRANVVFQAKFAEDGVEAAAPLAVVGGGVVEDDGDVVADVDRLNDGSRGWLRRSSVVVLVVGGRSRGGSHGSGCRGDRGGRRGGGEGIQERGSFGV
jgi:hypothetical protein